MGDQQHDNRCQPSRRPTMILSPPWHIPNTPAGRFNLPLSPCASCFCTRTFPGQFVHLAPALAKMGHSGGAGHGARRWSCRACAIQHRPARARHPARRAGTPAGRADAQSGGQSFAGRIGHPRNGSLAQKRLCARCGVCPFRLGEAMFVKAVFPAPGCWCMPSTTTAPKGRH